MEKERIILGIDPGTNIMGYGVIKIISNENGTNIYRKKQTEVKLLKLDIINLNKITEHELKLKKIFENSLQIIEEYKPDELAIEAPFYGKNVQSMLKLGRAQGVTMAAALYRQIPIFEYSPKKVKLSITGNGNASKEQVAAMIMNMLSIKEAPKYFDATDALGIAMCHYFQNNSPCEGKKYSGWKSFVSQNPDKISKK